MKAHESVGAIVGAILNGAVMTKITVKELEALTIADAGKKVRDDGGLVGVVRARADGVSVKFDWRYRFGGKIRQMACGTWPKDSLSAIRDGRNKARGILDAGKDPGEENKVARLSAKADQLEEAAEAMSKILAIEAKNARLTVIELFERWEKRELIGRKDKGAEVRRSFAKDIFPVLGAVAAEDITRAMVVGALDNVVERGAPSLRVTCWEIFARCLASA
jgi:hypothetical protein